MAMKVKKNKEFDYHLTPYKRSTPQIEESKRVIALLKNSIRSRLPQLISVVDTFDFVPVKENLLMVTDGMRVYYNPVNLMSQYNKNKSYQLECRILHMLMHGMLGHFEKNMDYTKKRVIWGLMDVQVADMFRKLSPYYGGSLNLFGDDVDSGAVSRVFLSDQFKNKIQSENLYHMALEKRAIAVDIIALERTLKRDDHRYWGKDVFQRVHDGKYIDVIIIQGRPADDESAGGLDKDTMEKLKQLWGQARAVICSVSGSSDLCQTLILLGSGIGIGTQRGDRNSHITPVIEDENRTISYKEVLREFIKEKELAVEDVDSIDTMLYTYGLDMYGDVPLVEPRDDNHISYIDSLAVAIDTSGSCDGEVASIFLRETLELLRELSGSVRFQNIYLIQCDYEIQEEICLGPEDIELLGEDMVFKGFGGTSFVPVFDRINELKDQGENVEGLIYLTDTYGAFPEYEPDYPVYFVVPDNESLVDPRYYQELPEWVNIVCIGGKEI